MSGVSPAPNETLERQQRAFLLHQLASAPDGSLSQSDAGKATPKQIKDDLKLTAAALKELYGSLALAGCITATKSGRTAVLVITEVGKLQHRELERYLPLMPAGGKVNATTDEGVTAAREAYVLDALARAPQHTVSRADLDVGFGGKGKPKLAELVATYPHLAPFRDQACLGLNPATTRAVLSELALRGDVRVHRTDGTESYTLTATGGERLGQLRAKCPVLPPTGKPAAAPSEAVREGREAFVLLKLFQSAKHTLWASDATVGSYPKPLKLNHATAWRVRESLARAGHLARAWDGKEGCYTLTAPGTRHLTTLSFGALGEVKLKGDALTELLAAARESAAPTLAGSAPAEPRTAPQLEAAVMDVFAELLRERFTVLGMVPVHEIRKAVAQSHGAQAASHAVLDDVLLGLRRAKRVQLISISDRSRATPEQLQDSVDAVGETFFYVEKAHDHAAGG